MIVSAITFQVDGVSQMPAILFMCPLYSPDPFAVVFVLVFELSCGLYFAGIDKEHIVILTAVVGLDVYAEK